MHRREFLIRSSCGLGAVWFTRRSVLNALAEVRLSQKFNATDTVTIGRTGVKTSRLAMGTGTVGSGGHSHQTALGMKGLPELLLNGYDQGLRFFDAADSYGSHPYVAAALKQLPRDKVAVLTKSWARDASGMRDDLDRFRRELGTDYLDICLMHCVTEGDWTTQYRGRWTYSQRRSRKGLSAHMDARAIPSRRCAPRRLPRGSK